MRLVLFGIVWYKNQGKIEYGQEKGAISVWGHALAGGSTHTHFHFCLKLKIEKIRTIRSEWTISTGFTHPSQQQ